MSTGLGGVLEDMAPTVTAAGVDQGAAVPQGGNRRLGSSSSLYNNAQSSEITSSEIISAELDSEERRPLGLASFSCF